ncbi:MAG: GlsB/YeaQ/YmgE family stress response membrane protein [Bacteroidales bacterium]|nr:GlsB/YeaQ/YmgE family stress response membrane protein [Bacteroidales bacterium]
MVIICHCCATLLNNYRFHWGGTLIGQIITAVVGAVILLWAISLIKKK